ncbi:hypothetical protein F0562_028879 [Nyssa sinensis]|uniref:Uncharacterized protein n=1 Tax=Nyssa sinensis TaxID=561372 RepID=A0A5J5B5H7_9ASTE|nr:hypothetical protein F0562_028879 [Nyssa sinensis]
MSGAESRWMCGLQQSQWDLLIRFRGWCVGFEGLVMKRWDGAAVPCGSGHAIGNKGAVGLRTEDGSSGSAPATWSETVGGADWAFGRL